MVRFLVRTARDEVRGLERQKWMASELKLCVITKKEAYWLLVHIGWEYQDELLEPLRYQAGSKEEKECSMSKIFSFQG